MRVSKLMVCAMLAAAAVPTIQAGSLSKEPSQSAEDFVIFREYFSFTTEDDFTKKWTVIDADKDSSTWEFEEYFGLSCTAYTDTGDWAISPEITIPETGSYVVKFNYSGVGDKEILKVWYGNGAAIDSMKNSPTPKVAYQEIGDGWYYASAKFVAEFNEGEKIHLGFQATTASDPARTDLSAVEMAPSVDSPVKTWDFEDGKDGKLPADLVFKAEDGGTLNPDMEEEFGETYAPTEFNEEGWGVLNNWMSTFFWEYGSLVGTFWIDGADTTDRWVIFPKVHVNSEDAHFVWESVYMSWEGDGRDPLDYEVKVSESTDSPTDFSTVLPVHEDPVGWPISHGISLAGYEGKDIYVAINFRTAAHQGFITLDNIGFYGDIDKEPTGTEAIRPLDTEEGFTIREDCITANGKDVKGIEIFTMSGAKVLQTEKPVLSTAALKPGIYIVRVRTSERAYTGKFVK